jgi:hypothetical protein
MLNARVVGVKEWEVMGSFWSLRMAIGEIGNCRRC